MHRSVRTLVAVSLLPMLAFVVLAGCAKSSSDDVSLADAKTAYAAVSVFSAYANPQEWPASWGGTETAVSDTEYTYTSPDGTFSLDLISDVSFHASPSIYPQHRTYTLVGKNLAVDGSSYTITGTIVSKLTFGSSGPTSLESTTIDVALSGGAVSKVTGSASSADMTTYSGTVTFDGTSFSVTQLM
jgi:hypothetical protein